MYNDENMKKIIEGALKNIHTNKELFDDIVSYIMKQIKKEQKKIDNSKIPDKYISYDLAYTNIHDISDETTPILYKDVINNKKEHIGYLYFRNNRYEDDIYKQILDYYSLLNLHTDEWNNWNYIDKDITNNDSNLSILIDQYNCFFENDEIDDNDTPVTSFIYTKLDDNLKLFSIYIINYNRETNIIYDFIRFIITLPNNANDLDCNNYYINLKKYFSNIKNIKDLLSNGIYGYIDRFKINHSLTLQITHEKVYNLVQEDCLQIIENKINLKSISYEIKKEDTPHTNTFVLDNVKFPHDKNGNLEILVTNDNDQNIINTGNKKFDEFISKAINDGYIKIKFLSSKYVYIDIDGKYIVMHNPYTENSI